MQKWSSNDPDLIPTKTGTPVVEIEPAPNKILGLVWRPDTDTFHFSATISSTGKFTKRRLASDIAKLYDPLGLISPVLIRAKTVLQQLFLKTALKDWLGRISSSRFTRALAYVLQSTVAD